MATWGEFQAQEPEFAARVQVLFDARRHKTMATLRADGSPRISGMEATFEDGELTFGSMPKSRKSADLRRDPRFALHSATIDPVEGEEAKWPGECKISGRAIIVAPPATAVPLANGEAAAESFRAEITEVVHTHLNDAATLLVVEWWTPERGLQRLERE